MRRWHAMSIPAPIRHGDIQDFSITIKITYHTTAGLRYTIFKSEDGKKCTLILINERSNFIHLDDLELIRKRNWHDLRVTVSMVEVPGEQEIGLDTQIFIDGKFLSNNKRSCHKTLGKIQFNGGSIPTRIEYMSYFRETLLGYNTSFFATLLETLDTNAGSHLFNMLMTSYANEFVASLPKVNRCKVIELLGTKILLEIPSCIDLLFMTQYKQRDFLKI